jgi:hypothetical protein
MRKASFWRQAANSLPEQVRSRYAAEFERAERWELALDAALEALARVKAALSRMFHTPRSAH